MFNVKFICRGRQKDDLRVLLSYNGQRTEISLGIKMTKETLEDSLKDYPSSKNIRYASMLRNHKKVIDEIRQKLQEKSVRKISVADVASEYRSYLGFDNYKEEGDFFFFYKKFISTKTNQSTKDIYNHTLNKLKQFDRQLSSRSFENVDYTYLTKFEDFLSRTVCKNARNIHLRNIRAVFNFAIENEATTEYPFRRFKIKSVTTRKRAMTIEELRDFFACPCEDFIKIHKDMFKLIFLCIGINVVDLYRLKHTDIVNGYIEYKRAKTGRLYSIKLEPEIQTLLDKYRGRKNLLCLADRWQDYRNFRSQINKNIKKVGRLERKGLGGKKFYEPINSDISTYWARHSWATVAAKLDIPKDTIAAALGHGQNTVTDIYIDYDQQKIDEANRKVIDYVLYDKK